MARVGNEERRYRMVWAAGERSVSADDPATLLAELIAGYQAVPEGRRRAVRTEHAELSLRRIQRRVLDAYDSFDCDSEEMQVLLNDRANRRVPQRWSAPVPLVLIDAHFAEAGADRPREAGGRIIWLETEDEESYVRSLAVAGEIFLVIRQDAVGAAAGGRGRPGVGAAVG
ncbi:hypothetical protein ACGFH8_18495 [Micromonospora sp. NPDC049175]|uniref:hypothetical protein n=1 Tax=Micromonospora sp. NPDC049175 TaxID=3364266 RepID=UPI0037210F62